VLKKPVLVKGSAITSRERWVREHHGQRGEARVREALSAESRELLEVGVLRSAWVSFSLFVELNETIDRTFGRGDLALCREMGAYGARVNLPSLYRIFYRVGSIAFILKRAARMWDVHYSSGRLSVTSGKGWARLMVEEFAEPHPTLWESVAGWGEASARLTGIADAFARLEHSPEADDSAPARIIIRWDPGGH